MSAHPPEQPDQAFPGVRLPQHPNSQSQLPVSLTCMGTQSSAPCKLDLSAPEFQYWRALKRVVKIWGGQGSYPEVHLNGTNTRFTQMLDLLPEPREGSWSEGARAFLKPLFGVTICPCHPTAREECRDLVFQVIRALQFTASPLSHSWGGWDCPPPVLPLEGAVGEVVPPAAASGSKRAPQGLHP